MKNVVWKFELTNVGTYQDNAVMLPSSARVVGFGHQHHPITEVSGLFFWVVVNPAADTVRRKFIVVPTGAQWAAQDLDHVMTSQDASGYMWHLLEWRKS